MTEIHSVWQTALAKYAEMGLPPPPIPDHLQPYIEQLDSWVYGTRRNVPNLYNMTAYVDEYLTHPPSPYAMFGHAGYGMNTYALHFYLVDGLLAIFDQVAWGGVYNDNDSALTLLRAHYTQFQIMRKQLVRCIDLEIINNDDRFLLALSSFGPSRWQFKRGTAPWVTQEGDSLPIFIAALQDIDKLLPDGE